jgi:hypothetical protein
MMVLLSAFSQFSMWQSINYVANMMNQHLFYSPGGCLNSTFFTIDNNLSKYLGQNIIQNLPYRNILELMSDNILKEHERIS